MTSLSGQPVPATVLALAESISRASGTLLIVGGWVRDALLGVASKDLDLEVYGLTAEAVDTILKPLGFTKPVGKHFPVWRHTRDAIDIAMPRLDEGDGESASDSTNAIERRFAAACEHRDFTINAMAWDPVGERLLDPLGGQADLAAPRLRLVHGEAFRRDPLRVLRAARFLSRLGLRLDPGPPDASDPADPTRPDEHAKLIAAARNIDLRALPIERLTGEITRILVELPAPWSAFEALEAMGQIDVLAPLAALKGVPQDPRWHPEGDVWRHTGLVVDRAAEIAGTLPPDDRLPLMLGALCHALGKPQTTERLEEGRIRSHGHEEAGAVLTQKWLGELRVSNRLRDAVVGLVRHHLAPAQLIAQDASPKAYRRLARKLAPAGLTLVDLERVARADHLGRTTDDAKARRFPAGDAFLAIADRLALKEGVRRDVVSASFLMARGVEAGPELGRLLALCRELQDEDGELDAETIAGRVLAAAAESSTGH